MGALAVVHMDPSPSLSHYYSTVMFDNVLRSAAGRTEGGRTEGDCDFQKGDGVFESDRVGPYGPTAFLENEN